MVSLGVVTILAGAGSGSGSGAAPPKRAADRRPSPDGVAAKFLADWAAGRTDAAALGTDKPDVAGRALRAWTTGLQATSVTITARPAAGIQVPFTVSLTAGSAGRWTYDSTLQVRGTKVLWTPGVAFPQLTDATTLKLTQVQGGAGGLVDRNGQPLSVGNYPSLGGILTALGERYPAGPGTAGWVVQIVDAAGAGVSTVNTFSPPTAGQGVKTTLDVRAQAAAEQAVAGRANAGLVVIQPSTGDILAIANNPPGGYDRALLARLAPGSTMKVITTAALLARGAGPSEQVTCPDSLTVDGKTFHNSEGEVTGTMSLTSAFARSCNTAFLGLRDRLPDGALSQEATSAFGLTNWDIGLGETVAYGQVPAPDGPTTAAADLIGQGTVQMSPLAIASVAATVATGSFHQPVLVPGARRVHAAGLPTAVAGDLRAMMRAVVTSGTARTSLAGLGDVAAKTGTAQVAGGADNAWLTAFRGDIAAGCLVEGGGFGASSCGPVVHQLLQTLA